MAAHEGCKRATAALKAQGISLVPDGLLMQLEISPFIGNPFIGNPALAQAWA